LSAQKAELKTVDMRLGFIEKEVSKIDGLITDMSDQKISNKIVHVLLGALVVFSGLDKLGGVSTVY
jgi:hypothetical protein